MSVSVPNSRLAWRQGVIDALPLVGGYLPVAVAFGAIAVQSGLDPLSATLISALVYSGASQFLFVALIASGLSPWLALLPPLAIGLRHLAYGTQLTYLLPESPRLRWLSHGMTDEVFALAVALLPTRPRETRLAWFTAAALVVWASWWLATLAGALLGEQLIDASAVAASALPFALSALFLVLILPRLKRARPGPALFTSIAVGFGCAQAGYPNLGIALGALAGGGALLLGRRKK